MSAIRSLVAVCSCVIALASALPAGGQELARLEITEWPVLVSRGDDLRIEGRGEGLIEGEAIGLQRWFAHTEEWAKIDSATPDARGNVAFEMDAPRYTARYRLKIDGAHSDFVRIAVRPRVALEVSRQDVMEGTDVVVRGTLRPAMPGRRGNLKRKIDGAWKTVERVRLGDGRFRVSLPMRADGRRPVKLTFAGDPLNSSASARVVVRVHRREPATWYGPGFFGNRTACGHRYDRDLLGVAHRTLPCGTMVSALYNGRSVRVPVVDRGPYGHANWDLTEETAQRLGFQGRDVIGVLPE